MKSPTFCPNPNCEWHDPNLDYSNHYTHFGIYFTKTYGLIHRFRCRHCGKTFSEQTFHLNYCTKRIVDYQVLRKLLTGSCSIRHMGRILGVNTRTIQNRIARLARQTIAVQSTLIPEIRLKEDLVADGFESFCVSQYFPNNIHILAGKDSQFIYYLDYVTLRRKGRMTSAQKKRRAILEKEFKADPGGIRKHFSKLLDYMVLLARNGSRKHLILFTDEKWQYQKAWYKNDSIRSLQYKVHCIHVRINSRLPRTLHNLLYSANYLDREFRKDLAEHVRETTRFGRNVCDSLNRLVVYQLWHNVYKKYRIRQSVSDNTTHCEMAGYDLSAWKRVLGTIYYERRFQSHLPELKGISRDIWFRNIETPLKKTDEYLPAYVSA